MQYLENNNNITQKYNIVNLDNGDILLTLKEIKINSLDDLDKFNFNNSKIISCTLNNENLEKLNYRHIIICIYNIIDSGTKIIKNSLINIKTVKCENKGFGYLENLGISFQNVCASKAIKEIYNQCKQNKIKLSMEIQLNESKLLFLSF